MNTQYIEENVLKLVLRFIKSQILPFCKQLNNRDVRYLYTTKTVCLIYVMFELYNTVQINIAFLDLPVPATRATLFNLYGSGLTIRGTRNEQLSNLMW